MTRVSKGIMDAGWALFALALTGCASVSGPEPETATADEVPAAAAPAPEAIEPEAATTAPAVVPSTEPAEPEAEAAAPTEEATPPAEAAPEVTEAEPESTEVAPAPEAAADTAEPAPEAVAPPVAAPSEEAAPAEPIAEPAPQPSEPLVLREGYPKNYTVKRGDTLWGLSTQYLRDPWRWPELWQKNPQVKNPHLIFPGDRLTLRYVDGQPTLQVQRAPETAVTTEVPPAEAPTAAATTEEIPAPEAKAPPPPLPVEIPRDRPYPTVKLSPQVRPLALEKAIPTIPLEAISQFLTRPRIVTEEELEEAPYIFSSVDEHLATGSGNRVYARGFTDDKGTENTDYVVVRKGAVYVNPEDSDDVLGMEATHVGDAQLVRMGDPATLDLKRTNREVLTGDRLLPADDGFVDQNFMPHSPPKFVDGTIIAVPDGVMQIGQFQVVVIDKGAEAGLDVGSVMAVYQASAQVRDTVGRETVRLPRERAGTVLVFRIFERLSYALVMDATRPIHVFDAVTSP